MKLKSVMLGFGLACALIGTSGLQASAPQKVSEKLAKATIIERLEASGQFKTLTAALEATDLLSTLEGEGPFTLLAPSDRAFAKLGQEKIDQLLAQPEELKDILLYHVVKGRVTAMQAFQAQKAATLNGSEITFVMKNNGFFINDSRLLFINVPASNGIIHVIDSVLLPAMAMEEAAVD